MSGSAVETISFGVEIGLKEEKVYDHIDEEKERDVGTWVLDTWATNHISECRAACKKLDMVVLATMHLGDDSVMRIKGHEIVVFVCKNGES
jgi:hypothetical protein